jgi:hypothetical protein
MCMSDSKASFVKGHEIDKQMSMEVRYVDIK